MHNSPHCGSIMFSAHKDMKVTNRVDSVHKDMKVKG